MEQLLVATDFSTRSDRALRRATMLANKLDLMLTLVHVVDIDRPQSLIAADHKAASQVLEDTVHTLCEVDRIRARWLVRVDDAHSGIISTANEVSADLIVLGPHRRRVSDVFVGTVAERVVRRSVRPLLVAVDLPAAHHRNTLLTLDFEDASTFACRRALEMGIFDHTDVVLIHAFDAPAAHLLRRSLEPKIKVDRYVESEGRAAKKRLTKLAQKLGLPPTCKSVVSTRGTIARTILETAKEIDSDLIVLGANQRHGFERALIGSVTADVIRDAHRDILIIPVDPG